MDVRAESGSLAVRVRERAGTVVGGSALMLALVTLPRYRLEELS